MNILDYCILCVLMHALMINEHKSTVSSVTCQLVSLSLNQRRNTPKTFNARVANIFPTIPTIRHPGQSAKVFFSFQAALSKVYLAKLISIKTSFTASFQRAAVGTLFSFMLKTRLRVQLAFALWHLKALFVRPCLVWKGLIVLYQQDVLLLDVFKCSKYKLALACPLKELFDIFVGCIVVVELIVC